jgi:hypothetical protein
VESLLQKQSWQQQLEKEQASVRTAGDHIGIGSFVAQKDFAGPEVIQEGGGALGIAFGSPGG